MKLPPTNKRTDPEIEHQVVTLIARGDRYAAISEETGVPVPTIKKIKGRNSTALAKIESQVVQRQARSVTRILDKSLKQIEHRLDRAAEGKEDISLRELVTVAKEMFQQSQIEQGKPMAIIKSPEVAQEHLRTLLVAIQTDDEVEMERLIFSPMDANRH